MADEVVDLLPDYLARQRWYSGTEAPQKVVVVSEEENLGDAPLHHLIVEADGVTYQLLLARSDEHAPPAYLHGQDNAIVGVADGALIYDALLDSDLARVLLGTVVPGETAERVRPITAEQSNSSVVYDDRIILKVFRRVGNDTNPDVMVTQALDEVGYSHVARPLGVWRQDGMDLAFAQQFLVDGFEGWQLALTSLRDYYARGNGDPAAAGGDFAGEACRLGQATAEMHLAMAEAFGDSPPEVEVWISGIGPRPFAELENTVERFRTVADPGRAIRVHGDFHLGQTIRTDSGWYILDFEGEPARSLEERNRPSSPFKDVAGMLRSFHYATAVALADQEEAQQEQLEALAEAWEQRNREAFLDGYFGTEGIDRLLPGDEQSRETVLAGFELEKAVYELSYEEHHRPDWVRIPMAALHRLVAKI
jgi:maltokinase